MTLAAATLGPGLDRSMGDLLEAVSRETWDLHNAAVRLQTMAGELIERASLAAHDPLIEEAQTLDALAQKLDALTGFLQRLGATAPEGWRMDISHAVSPVFLADLAKRLSREPSSDEDGQAPTGDCELF